MNLIFTQNFPVRPETFGTTLVKSKSKLLYSKRFQIKIMYKMIFKIEIIQINLLAFLQCSETVSLSIISVTHSGVLST